MKHAFLLSTAAVACVALASASWAQQSSQAPDSQHGQGSDHQGKGRPAAAAVDRAAAAQHGRQATVQGAPSVQGHDWSRAVTRGPATDVQSQQAPRYVARTPRNGPQFGGPVTDVQSQQTPRFVARTPRNGPQYGAARDTTSVGGATRTASERAQFNGRGSHQNRQASQRFSAGAYRPPMGYVSRRWDYGQRLPAAYYARGYWINDYLLYALYGPPSGFVWVRVGDDALLINRYTGEIVAVETGVFY